MLQSRLYELLKVLGYRPIYEIKVAYISDKAQPKTQRVDFVTASQPDAEFELLAGRTLSLASLFYLPGSFLDLSNELTSKCESLEAEKYQSSMHGCMRLSERGLEFEKTTIEPKYQNQKMLFQSGYVQVMEKFRGKPRDDNLLYEHDCDQKLETLGSTKEHKYEELTTLQSCLEEMWELKSEDCRNESVNAFANSQGKYFSLYPVPAGLPNRPLPQSDKAVTGLFNLSMKGGAFSFLCILEWYCNALSIWPEPDEKSPFLAPLPGEQPVLSRILSSPHPSKLGGFESDFSPNGCIHNWEKLKNDQPTLVMTEVSTEEIASATSKSPLEYLSWELLPSWSTKNLLLHLTGVITDMYNLFLKGLAVLSPFKACIVHPRLERSDRDQEDRNIYGSVASLILLLNI